MTRPNQDKPATVRTDLRVAVIIGSTRPGRIGGSVGTWFADEAAQRADTVIDVIDLAEVDLPAVFPTGPEAAVEAYLDRIEAADAFVVVTPEYNHGYPASLKQAIDLGHRQWHAKPVGFVAYGGMAGGMRAVEQLRQVFAELHATTIRDVVGFHGVHQQFRDGRPTNPDQAAIAAKVMLDQLAWWAHALRAARVARPYAA